MNESRGDDKYIPALSYDPQAPLYDLAVRATVSELAFKKSLIAQADVRSGHRVLDVR